MKELKSWETPTLEVLGDLETLTASGGSDIPDSADTTANLPST